MKRATFFVVLSVIGSSVATAQFSGFGGPSVMGRSQGASIARRSQQVRMRFFGSIRAMYDSGLTAVNVDPDGAPLTARLYGGDVRGGVYGTKSWRKTDLALGYIAGYRLYSGRSGNRNLNGSDHALQIGVSHNINKRMFLQSTTYASTMSRAYGFGYGFVTPGQSFDPALIPSPQNEIYDSRIYNVSSAGTLGYILNPRTSVSVGGGAFLTRRTNNLISANGVQAFGDVAHRLTRRQTVSLGYAFFQFNFSDRYGNSSVNQLFATYSIQFNRYDVTASMGAGRVESEGIRLVQIDPAIAAIIGQTTGAEAFHTKNFYPMYRVGINGKFRRATVGLAGSRQVVPGNGILLTSVSSGVTGYYSYTGLRKWNFQLRGGYGTYSGQARFNNKSEYFDGGLQAGYQLRSDLQFTLSTYYRDQSTTRGTNVGGTNFNGSGVRVSVGLAYSPGDIPLALW